MIQLSLCYNIPPLARSSSIARLATFTLLIESRASHSENAFAITILKQSSQALLVRGLARI